MDPVARFLLAVAVILLVAHSCGRLARALGQPQVVGEMTGGLLLGPSALGLASPEAMAWLFPPELLEDLDRVGQLGLVVFMFLLGSELRTDRVGRRRDVAAVVLGSVGLPLAAGAGVAVLFAPLLSPTGLPSPRYVLFVGLAMAITALPVLARILVELGVVDTVPGALSLTAAAVGDAMAWFLLTALLAGGSAAGPIAAPAAALTVTLGLLGAFVCLRPLLALLVTHVRSEQLLAVILTAGAVGFAALTQALDLHPVIGAFVFGAAVPRGAPAIHRVRAQLQGFTVLILLPVFFVGVGLNTAFNLIGVDPMRWLALVVIVVTAVGTKAVGAGGAAVLVGLPRLQALRVGLLMNCRGVTELVVASIGYASGLITQLGFTIFVLVALVTTAMTGPLVRWTWRGAQPVHDHIEPSRS